MSNQKKSLDDYLKEVDYSYLNSNKYEPSVFALQFVNFIKLVNGSQGESNKTPPIHLRMLDTITYRKRNHLVNLCARGTAKTTLFGEYMVLYLAVFNELPKLKDISGMIYIADTMENGAKSLRKNIEYRYNHSEFLQSVLPRESAKFTDNYIEFTNISGKQFGVKLFGATTGIRGTKIFGRRPQIACHAIGTPIQTELGWHKVENYPIQLGFKEDFGLKVRAFGLVSAEVVTQDHRYMVASQIRTRKKEYLDNGKTLSTTSYEWVEPHWVETKDLAVGKNLGNQRKQFDYFVKKVDMTVKPIPEINTFYQSVITERNSQGRVTAAEREAVSKVHEKMHLDAWWWLYGLYLSDGTTSPNKVGFYIANTQEDTVGKKLQEVCDQVGYTLTSRRQRIGCYYQEICDAPLSRFLRENHLGNSVKNIPNWVLYIDLEKQKQLLLGYIAGDGYIDKKRGQIRINSVNPDAICKLGTMCERIGLPYHIRWTRTKEFDTVLPSGQICLSHKQWELRLSQQVKEILGINIEAKKSDQVFFRNGYLYRKVKSVEGLKEKRTFVPINTPTHEYQTMFGTSHNCLDDLISDESAKSKTVMDLIKDTVYKGVDPALDPNGSLVILSGTPFNKEDIILEAVESGAWETNVYPICERFPCTRDEFQGAWEDRFTYDFIKESYERYKLSGKLGAFYQELMLQITSDEDRMVLDSEIRWYKRSDLMKNRSSFNFYITTDFATSSKTTADFSVISVWAVNGNEDWYWVDGIVAKQSMDKTIDDLFRLIQKYKPLQVGIEITGQQGAFISLLQREMMHRSIWFNFASSDKTGNTPGIRPTTDKLSRFNYVLPKFKAGKIYFPEEAKDGRELTEFMLELKLATYAGFKGHDDCIDTISQLTYLKVILPSSDIGGNLDSSGIWDDNSYMEDTIGMNNYIV